MRHLILKAQAKKKKYLKRIEKDKIEEDSDGSLSSDNEEEYSDDLVGKLVNDKYIIVKYLGRGSFSKVWMVLDIINNKYYALKIQDYKYREEIDNEIKYIKILQKDYVKIENGETNLKKGFNFSDINFGLMKDNFIFKINNKECRCLLMELLGDSLDKLCYNENDNLLTTKLVKKIIRDIISGLVLLHKNNILHTDLKMDNLLFNSLSKKLLDYKNKIENLKISEYFSNLFENSLPKEIMLLDKNKRKVIKRKVKQRSFKDTTKYFYNELRQLNKNDLDNKKKLDIIELDNEIEIDEKNKLLLDLNNVYVKIIDFGNAETMDNRNQDTIYTRSYRPPENIIDYDYNTKSDIWVIGCILYELLNGDYLFDLRDYDFKNNIDKDRKHISLMYGVLGKMPRDMAFECQLTDDIFDSKGRIIKNRDIEMRDIRKELTERIDIEENELDLIEDLLYKILEYDPKKRLSAEEVLAHKWFNI